MKPLRVAAALTAALGLLAAGSGCDDGLDIPDSGGFLFDRGVGEPPPAPVVSDFEPRVPWPVATLRGRAMDARRVIVTGGENPLATPVLPTEEFCIDVRMPAPGTYVFELQSQSDPGALSTGTATVTVEFDPSSPPIPGATTCDGSDPAGCMAAEEICDNTRDDDCDGLADDFDPDCADCTDDVLEPNDDTGAPRVMPGRYDGLYLCAANEDYYGIYARAGDTIDVSLFFVHGNGDLDLELLGTDRTTVLTSSMSMDDDEFVSHTAATDGEYKLRVFGIGGASNEYTLDVDVTSSM